MNRTLYILGCLAATAIAHTTASAQFHSQDSNGSTQMRQMHNPTAGRTPSRASYIPSANRSKGLHNPSIKKGGANVLIGSDVRAENAQLQAATQPGVLQGVAGTAAQGQALVAAVKEGKVSKDFPINLKEYKHNPNVGFRNLAVGVGTMDFGDSDVWGRCENHSDGTYTETIFDLDNAQMQNGESSPQTAGLTVVTQRTRRPSLEHTKDPILLVRKIYLDSFGVPKKVDIFDGNNNLKFKGFFIYDKFQRLAEEQIFQPNAGTNMSGFKDSYSREGLTLVRRKEYPYNETTGEPLAPRNWDYCRCGRNHGKRSSASGCSHCMHSNGQELVALIRTKHNQEIVDDQINRLKDDINKGYLGNKKRKAATRSDRVGNAQRPAPKAFFNNKAAQQTTPVAAESQPLKRPKFNLFRRNK